VPKLPLCRPTDTAQRRPRVGRTGSCHDREPCAHFCSRPHPSVRGPDRHDSFALAGGSAVAVALPREQRSGRAAPLVRSNHQRLRLPDPCGAVAGRRCCWRGIAALRRRRPRSRKQSSRPAASPARACYRFHAEALTRSIALGARACLCRPRERPSAADFSFSGKAPSTGTRSRRPLSAHCDPGVEFWVPARATVRVGSKAEPRSGSIAI